ncbi:MAG: hypothetical protein KAR01_12345, partial [Desulfocapsa sp.]|nr:hypothetical protein [Desulfocapsa sp.]
MKIKFKQTHPLLSVGIGAFVCMSFAGVQPANAAADPANEWKKWQTKFNHEMASKQPEKKAMWMDKELVEKVLTIDDANLPNTEKRGVTKENCLTCHDGVEQISA